MVNKRLGMLPNGIAERVKKKNKVEWTWVPKQGIFYSYSDEYQSKGGWRGVPGLLKKMGSQDFLIWKTDSLVRFWECLRISISSPKGICDWMMVQAINLVWITRMVISEVAYWTAVGLPFALVLYASHVPEVWIAGIRRSYLRIFLHIGGAYYKCWIFMLKMPGSRGYGLHIILWFWVKMVRMRRLQRILPSRWSLFLGREEKCVGRVWD